jgi:acyl carrier protein
MRFRLERRFGISIDDEEQIYLYVSPARVEWLVRERMANRKPAIVDVYEHGKLMQGALKSVAGLNTGWLSSMSFERTFPKEHRQELWDAFGAALRIRLPALELADSPHPRIPWYVSDYGKLTFWLLNHHPESFPIKRSGTPLLPLGTGRWLKDDEITVGIVEVICDCLGVKAIEVTPDSLLVDELGMA